VPDIHIPAQWTSVYAASGIAVGNQLRIQNKGSLIFIHETATPPACGESCGWALQPFKDIIVDKGSPGVWAWSPSGSCTLYVQDGGAE
jgi:hypothetical protein